MGVPPSECAPIPCEARDRDDFQDHTFKGDVTVAPDDTRHDRRQDDKVAEMMNDRISELSQQLQAHITDCSEQSRKLFWAVLSVLAFLVVKSLPFISKMFVE